MVIVITPTNFSIAVNRYGQYGTSSTTTSPLLGSLQDNVKSTMAKTVVDKAVHGQRHAAVVAGRAWWRAVAGQAE
jgi:hypothetical protein